MRLPKTVLHTLVSPRWGKVQNPQAFKEQLIAGFCGESTQIRDDFIERMSRWLSEATQ